MPNKNKLFVNIKKLVSEPLFQGLVLFALVFALFLWFGASSYFPDPDSFYHAKIAELLSQGEFHQTLPWQQFTVLKDYGIDQHFLWHIFLIPFVWLPFPFGIKFSVVILASAVILAFYFLLKKQKVPYSWWLTLLLATLTPWTFRINLVKANTTSLLFLLFGLYFIFKSKKTKWDNLAIFLLAFFYVWAYGGFILLPFFVGLYWLISSLLEAVKSESNPNKFFSWLWQNFKFFLKAAFQKSKIFFIISSGAGMLAGIIINPFFPKNLLYWWDQLIQIGIVNYQDKIGVGGEWYPYPIFDLTAGNIVLVILLFVALGGFFVKIKKQTAASWTSLLLAIFFTWWNLKSRRYVEYSVPFVALFTALSLRDSFSFYKVKDFYKTFLKYFKSKKIVLSLIVLALLPIIVLSLGITIKEQQSTKRDLSHGIQADKFLVSMTWLKENSNQGEIVLHSDWDEWPLLFFHNTHNYYIVGLDPTFMYNYDQDLYWKWVNITLGKQKTDLCTIIPEDFKAGYVFLETDHTGMDNNVNNAGCFELVYEDQEAKIYKVIVGQDERAD